MTKLESLRRKIECTDYIPKGARANIPRATRADILLLLDALDAAVEMRSDPTGLIEYMPGCDCEGCDVVVAFDAALKKLENS